MKAVDEAGVNPEVNPGVRRIFIRTFVLPSLAFLGAVGLAFIFGAEVSGWFRYAPFALSLVLFGLPHGAVDHLVPGRLYKGRASIRSISWVFILYLALAMLYLAAWFEYPGPAFVFFIALTWFHWGQGDLYFMATLGRNVGTEPFYLKILTIFVRGGMPMLVPLLAFPEVYRAIASDIVKLFGGDASTLAWAFDPTFRFLAGVVFITIILVVLYQGHRSSGGSFVWRLDVAEVVLLAVYFTVAPPVLALGLYFCLWHSPRHVARLMLLNKTSAAALEQSRIVKALRVFIRDAAPLTAAAIALLAGLYFAVPGPVDGAGGLLAVYLVLISTLTLPHVAIVCLMDLRQGVWR